MTTSTTTPTVAVVAHEGVRSVHPSASLREAAVELTGEGVGALVVGALAPEGIFSAVDLARALAEGEDPDAARVGDWMTEDPVSIDRDATLSEAAAAMARAQVRHLLVTQRGQAWGVVSSRDLLVHLSDTA